MLMYVSFWYMLRGELAFKKYLKDLESEKENNGEGGGEGD
jgi:hypothetical protein